jgi:lysophospholipase L1-like esterase
MQKDGRLYLRISLAVAALLIGLLLAEGLTRAFELAPKVYRIRASEGDSAYRLCSNPVLGYLLKSDYRDDDPDLHNSFPRTNAHGFRDLPRSIPKPANTNRVLVLGDSVVVGHGIPDLNDTISRELEKRLSPDGVEVLNFGVGGYCTAGEVELLATRGLAYSPDLVVLVFTENDYLDQNSLIAESSPERPRWAERLFVESHFFRLLAVSTNLFEFRAATDPDAYVKRHCRAIEENNVVGALRRMAILSRDEGFKVMIAVWPAFVDGAIVDRHAMVDEPDRLFVEIVSQDCGLPCFRLSPYFREDLRHRGGDPSRLYTIGDVMHPNPLGAEVGADAIASILNSRPRLLDGR